MSKWSNPKVGRSQASKQNVFSLFSHTPSPRPNIANLLAHPPWDPGRLRLFIELIGSAHGQKVRAGLGPQKKGAFRVPKEITHSAHSFQPRRQRKQFKQFKQMGEEMLHRAVDHPESHLVLR